MPDHINCIFQGIGAALVWWNVWALYRSKQARGVKWETTLYFALWGAWNLVFYSSLAQWWSFVAGVFLCGGNTAWVVLWFRYRGRCPGCEKCWNRKYHWCWSGCGCKYIVFGADNAKN